MSVQENDLDMAARKARDKFLLPVLILPYFLFCFARGGSPAGASVVVAATAYGGTDLDGSSNRGSSSMTSNVLLSWIPARSDCTVDSWIESVSVPKDEPDPEAVGRGSDDILSPTTA